MTVATPFQAYLLSTLTDRYRRGISSRAVLCNPAVAFTDTATILDVIVSEVVNANVGRIDITPSADATWNSSKIRAQIDFPVANFSIPSGGTDASYRAIVRCWGIGANPPRLVTSIDAANNKLFFLNSVAHQISNNEPLAIVARAGGTVPAELLSSGNPRIVYAVNQVSTLNVEQSIQVSLTPSGTPIDFSGGSGNIDVRSLGTAANGLGVAEFWIDYGATQTLRAGGATLSFDMLQGRGKPGTDVLNP